jgi:hypothetical protein
LLKGLKKDCIPHVIIYECGKKIAELKSLSFHQNILYNLHCSAALKKIGHQGLLHAGNSPCRPTGLGLWTPAQSKLVGNLTQNKKTSIQKV